MTETAQALTRATLRDQAESSLRELIVSGELPPGSRVNEVAVAARLGISRAPLREAIQSLVHQGLLDAERHRGAFVPTVSAGQLRDLYELRSALETYAVKLLAGLPHTAGVSSLHKLLEAAEAQLAQESGYPNDADFHHGIFAAVGNDALTSAAEQVQVRISVARARSARNPDRARQALEEHREILTAVSEGRKGAAMEAMERHLSSSYENALQTLPSRAAGRD